MGPKKSIPVKRFLADFHKGVSEVELCKTYALTSRDLKRLFQKLLEVKAITQDHLDKRVELTDTSGVHTRDATRSYSLFSIPVYDTENLELEGWIEDITRKGLQVSGMGAIEGQSRSLLIRADEFHDIYPFAFDALCRWVKKDEDNNTVVGFEIVDISDTGIKELEKLIQILTIH